MYLGLHIGEVFYGNVGSRERLDFTVIGPAVNETSLVKPDTVIRWHRAGFRLFWRWKSRSRLGRPAVPAEIR